jgi:hypothetical protein
MPKTQKTIHKAISIPITLSGIFNLSTTSIMQVGVRFELQYGGTHETVLL